MEYKSIEDMINKSKSVKNETILEKKKDHVACQSHRIWNELYKVLYRSDVVAHVLDARDPLGTRCNQIKDFVDNEAK